MTIPVYNPYHNDAHKSSLRKACLFLAVAVSLVYALITIFPHHQNRFEEAATYDFLDDERKIDRIGNKKKKPP